MANIKFDGTTHEDVKISRYQTVDFEFTPEITLDQIECLYFTLKQGTVVIEKAVTAFVAGDTSVVIELSQTDTATLKSTSACQCQIRYKSLNDKAYVTPIVEYKVSDVLKDVQI